MTIIYIYVALASYNTGYLTKAMSSIENIVDEAANIAVVDNKGRINRKGGHSGPSSGRAAYRPKTASQWAAIWSEGTDAVMDVPIGGVCEVLYSSDD